MEVYKSWNNSWIQERILSECEIRHKNKTHLIASHIKWKVEKNDKMITDNVSFIAQTNMGKARSIT